MLDFLRDFFSKKEVFSRSIRATALALAAALLTPDGQAALASVAGPYAALIPIVVALLGGFVAAGEKNKE